jgi:rhodanese-related sulfurtransferase
METILPWLIWVAFGWFLVQKLLPPKGVSTITTNEAKARTKDRDTQWIDVRTPNEYKANHTKPFMNVPLAELPSRSRELKKDKEVVVICQSGMRSRKAATILKKQGFQKITNVKGGMAAWR